MRYCRNIILILHLFLLNYNICADDQVESDSIKANIRFLDGFVDNEKIIITLEKNEREIIVFSDNIIKIDYHNYHAFSISIPRYELTKIKINFKDRDKVFYYGLFVGESQIFIDLSINLKNEIYFVISDKLIQVE